MKVTAGFFSNIAEHISISFGKKLSEGLSIVDYTHFSCDNIYNTVVAF